MSLPKGSEVEAQSSGTGGSTTVPSSVPPPCPSGDVPKEGSRDIQQKGKIISVPHDWCKSTDSPVPYKIWAWQSSASNLANTVRQTDCHSHVLGSIVNQCYGDEPGTGGGVKSGTNLAECTPLSASPTVRAEGKPMVRYLDKWWMNHKNTWGCLNNSEDMGKYDPPKLQKINAKLSPIPSREDDLKSLAGGTQLAGATGVLGAPTAGGGVGETLGQIGRGVVSGGKWVAGGAEELGVGAAAGTAALAGGFLLLMTSSTASDDTVRVTQQKRKCGPCITIKGRIVPVGTIGWLFHRVPPSRPHYPYKGDHYNLFRAQQNPYNCRCFWQPFGDQDGTNGAPAPLGSMPIEDFSNIE